MGMAKTYFEQVPLEVVKKVLEQQTVVQTDTASDLVMVNSSATDTGDLELIDVQALEYPSWQKSCQEALIELDREKLKEKVAAAEVMVFQRLQEIAHRADGQAERQALLDVTSSLRFLKRDVLKFPDWESNAKS
jgi:hypothetical protein